jgi:hypothetical protein
LRARDVRDEVGWFEWMKRARTQLDVYVAFELPGNRMYDAAERD